jgi:predicted transcriptional regulator
MRRSREAIYAQILEVCAVGAGKTRIVYQANLNFRTVRPHLKFLINKGWINMEEKEAEVEGVKHEIYRTTPKGLEFMEIYKEMRKALS